MNKRINYKTPVLFVLLLSVAILIAACGGSGNEPKNSPEAGNELFQQATIGTVAGCKTCHSLEPGVVIIGPSLAGIGTLAGSRVAGLSAEEYLKQAILDPDAYVVADFPASVMPNVYGKQLEDEQVMDLVNYMLALK